VVSDLGGVKSMVEGHMAKQMGYEDAVAQSVMAGCDFSDAEYEKYIPDAVRAGKLNVARLDDAVRRVLTVRMRLGEFDPQEAQPWSKIPLDVIDCPAHRALALEAARQAIVLLRNQDALLPLEPQRLKQIAVLGPFADRVVVNNYNGQFRDAVAPLQGLRDRLGTQCAVVHAPGAPVRSGTHTQDQETAKPPVDAAAELQRAVTLAGQADAAVVCVGTDDSIEQEGRDRKSLDLPECQLELVRKIHAANPRTVVVLCNAGPLTVPWIAQNIPAVVQAWWGGEEGGHALADVLLGSVNPSGRLPYTVYAAEAQVPPRDEYDISKGFTYQYIKGEPLWAFGHGLGYTTFEYSGLQISPEKFAGAGRVTITCDIKNTGARAGAEVVQLYTHSRRTGAIRPLQQLRGFQRVRLEPSQSRTLTFILSAERWSFWDENAHAFRLDTGAYDIWLGPSSADHRLHGTLECAATP
jgi:beta-glucosidase